MAGLPINEYQLEISNPNADDPHSGSTVLSSTRQDGAGESVGSQNVRGSEGMCMSLCMPVSPSAVGV